MVNVIVDDRDPSVIYSTGWAKAGVSSEYNSTTTWTGVAGSIARVSFVGSSIGVYGTVVGKEKDAIAPVSLYSIDGGSAAMFRADQPDSTKYHQLFFQSPVLPEAAHVLTITYEGDQTDPLFLDYFTVDEATISASSLTTTSSSSSSSVPLSTSTTPIPTPPTPTPTPPTPVIVTITSTAVAGGLDANASSSPSAVSGASTGHAGAVAGGIIGGIAVLFLAAFAFIMWRRRRSKNRNPYNFKDHNGTSWARPILDDPPSPVRQPISLNTPPPPPAPVMSQYTGSQYGDGYYPGGYSSASAYNSYQQYQLTHSPYNYSPSEEYDGYGGGVALSPQTYPQQGYTPPSQLLKPALGN